MNVLVIKYSEYWSHLIYADITPNVLFDSSGMSGTKYVLNTHTHTHTHTPTAETNAWLTGKIDENLQSQRS